MATPHWYMTIPTVTPIAVPLPSLDHRQICVAGLARGHPDSGEAAIMGVPLPHLVFSINTELFADVPPSFSFLWTCRRSGVSSPYGGLAPNVFALLCRDVGGPGTQQVPMVVRPSWEQWSLRG